MPIAKPQNPDAQIVCLAEAITKANHNTDRRSGVRLGPDDLRWLCAARLKYGSDVRVIDLSVGGIVVETAGALPQSSVVFELSSRVSSVLIPARVLRSRTAWWDGATLHQSACQFKWPLDVPALVKPRR